MGLRVPRPVARLCLNVPAAGSAFTTRTYEHDACGVALVAQLDGEPSHETVERADRGAREPRAPRRGGRRPEHGRRRRHPAPDAGRVHPRRDRRGAAAAGAYGVGVCFLPRDEERRAELEQLLERHGRAPRASASSAGATSRSTRTTSASRPTCTRRTSSSSSSPRPTSCAGDQDAFERKLYVIRRVAEIAAGPELVIPRFSSRTIVYKGMLTARSCWATTPTCRTRARSRRSRSSTRRFSHEHVPELGARAPVPDDRPQRRDQHAARQRQLDARARVAARLRAVRRRPAEGAAGRAAGRLATRRRSTTCSSCSCWPAAACRTR